MDEQLGGLNSTYIYLWLAFNVWMIIDAVRRKAASYWYFVILFFPLGALLYFFIVKVRDLQPGANNKTIESDSLKSEPSIRSGVSDAKPDLDHADNLEEGEQYAEAETIFRRALELDDSNKQALHGLARCLVGLRRAHESLAQFERLLELDREYRNYSAALDYADALWEAGQHTDTLELLERLAEITGRINHRLAFSHYLAASGKPTRAREEITRALEAASKQPDASSTRIRQWIERGEQMLAELDKADESSTQ
jgi:hypothetical protein